MILRRVTPRLLRSCWLALAVGMGMAFSVSAAPVTNVVFTITNAWRFSTNNLDGTDWSARSYDDSAWAGPGSALLYVETAALPAPKNTPLPQRAGNGPLACYFFRTTFTLTNAAQTTALRFTNLVDDGAVFYLNGAEIQRVRMNAGPVAYLTQASSTPPGGDATSVETFTVTGLVLTNLVNGTNVLAVRVHQSGTASSDVVFGSGLAVVSDADAPPLVALTSPTNAAQFVTPVTIELTAGAVAPAGTVTNVSFFANGVLLGSDATATYAWTWTNPVAGNYALTVVAADQLGQTNVSATINISVINPSLGTLTRRPYLQLSTPTSIVVRWRTDVITGSRVVYGTNLAALNFTNDDPSAVTEHIVTLTNLQPDTQYFYTVGNGLGTLAGPDVNQFFLTHPPEGATKPVRLWVIGDAGTADLNQIAVRDAFYNWNGTNRVHAWLQLGDNAYVAGTDAEYQAGVFNIYSNILRNSVTWPTLGNHDANNGSTAFVETYPYFNIFTLPAAGEAGGVPSGTEHYYSFDLGMVHVICLDSQTADRSSNGAMAMWLQADLAATTNRWVIAMFHHPPYSKGSHDSDTETALVQMRQNFNPILEAGGVDLVLSGHSHCYERSFLLNGHYGVSTNFTTNYIVQPGGGRITNGVGGYVKPENFVGTPIGGRGTIYAVAGSSGQNDGGLLNHPAMFISLNVLGSLVLDITSNRLDATFLRENGATNDTFTIFKTNYAPVASNLVFSLAADTATNLVLAGSDVNRNPLTFQTIASPTNGLVSSFNPVTGTFTYTPARGATNADALSFRVSDGQTNSTLANVTLNVLPPVDANTNGIADSWETLYGVSDPAADTDGDGQSARQEYWAGTNPNDRNDWLRVSETSGNGVSAFTIMWPAKGGVRYRIRWSNGDAGGQFNGVFTPLVRTVAEEMCPLAPGVSGPMSFTDEFTATGLPLAGKRYYQVDVVR